MKAALISFLSTLIAVCAAFLLHLRTSSAERHDNTDAGNPGGAARAPVVSGPNTATRGETIEKPSDSNRAQELTAEARNIVTLHPMAGNICKWWNVICALAELDPSLAIQTIREAPEKFLGDEFHPFSGTADSIVAWWAARDPAAALEWYWQDAALRRMASRPPWEIIQTLARRNVGQAIGFIRRYFELAGPRAEGEGSSTLLDGLRVKTSLTLMGTLSSLRPWLRTTEDFEALLPLVEALPDEAKRAGFYQSMVSTLASTMDAGAVRSFLDRHPLPLDWPVDQAYPVAALTEQAIRSGGEPAEWIAWSMESTGSTGSTPRRTDLRSQVATAITRAWTARDPEAAGQWLQSFAHSDPSASLIAMRTYASATVNDDPVAAMAWITASPDETVKRQNMILYFPKWADKDPIAAGSWLASAPWPEEIKRLAGAVLHAGNGLQE